MHHILNWFLKILHSVCVYMFFFHPGFGLSPLQKLCEVRVKGVFPTLQVIDACTAGSVARLSKQYLWKLFSLDSLNEQLLSTPSPGELTFKTPTKHRLVDVILSIIGLLKKGTFMLKSKCHNFLPSSSTFKKSSPNYATLWCVLNIILCFIL